MQVTQTFGFFRVFQTQKLKTIGGQFTNDLTISLSYILR